MKLTTKRAQNMVGALAGDMSGSVYEEGGCLHGK